jgi:hypothetical protein
MVLSWRFLQSIFVVLVAGAGSALTAPQGSQVKIEVRHDMSREGRWLFHSASSGERLLPVIGRRWNNYGYYGKQLRVRLNDGGIGRVRFRESPQIIHEPNDSLKLQGDDYFVEVTDAKGRVKASIHLWASYGWFQIAASDLVGGPADELLLISQQIRGTVFSPQLQIWSVEGARPVEIARMIISGSISTCGRWEYDVHISGMKTPRELKMKRRLSAAEGCDQVIEDADRLTADIPEKRTYKFSRGKYREVIGGRIVGQRMIDIIEGNQTTGVETGVKY